MGTQEMDYLALMSAALIPDDIVTLALAGVISMRSHRKPPYHVPIAGLEGRELRALLDRYFPGAAVLDLVADEPAMAERTDEFSDLLALLVEYRTVGNRESRWLAHAIATASMAENHLWQDMGLPDRAALSRLMSQYFMPLASRNVNNMRWKKFFYRQLCERSGLSICRSPSCAVCTDYRNCFGPEEPVAKVLLSVA